MASQFTLTIILYFPPSIFKLRKPYLKATAPKRPPSSRHWWTHSVCWLAAAFCWLTHSPNCPWAPWNLQPIWLSACTHISKHCIDWKRGSEWITLADLITVRKWSSWGKVGINIGNAECYFYANEINASGLDIIHLRVCVRDREMEIMDSCCLSSLSD